MYLMSFIVSLFFLLLLLFVILLKGGVHSTKYDDEVLTNIGSTHWGLLVYESTIC